MVFLEVLGCVLLGGLVGGLFVSFLMNFDGE